ncbi:MAG: hypothetical protein QN193_09905 [Armatimonadota bacterium]|nr:hypothetical protein [Armatimonadota bacterium]MDR7444274.1 hypothetical protein [Armatimonadota bacterium]MDR7570909.1 hypothetical protein [Armatimonadota bacterium]MDR7614192.1 hypothetical protein [Armatimonadota bacterium]
MAPNGRGGVVAWVEVSLAAAAMAGLLAVLITAGRLAPLVRHIPPELFYKALVGHVTFSLVVWLMSCSAAVALHRSGTRPAPLSPYLAILGLGGLLAGLALPGRPVVVDYLPYVASPIYAVGYGLVALGALSALTPCLRIEGREISAHGARSLALAYIASLLAAAVGLGRIGTANPQVALWGAGHALQFVYVTALALAWHALAEAGYGVPPADGPAARSAYTLSALLPFLSILLYLAPDPSGLPRWTLTNAALGGALSIPTLLHLSAILPRIREASPRPGGSIERTALWWSVGLYLLGGILAPIGAVQSLRITAHYHAMLVGGVTTAFMGMVYRMLEENGYGVLPRAGRAQLNLFGGGAMLTVAALLLAAGSGMPRKAYLAGPHPWNLPLALLAAAGLLAACGGGWFLISAWRILSRRAPEPAAIPALLRGP